MRIYQLFSSYYDAIMTVQIFRYNVTLKKKFVFILEREREREKHPCERETMVHTLTRDGACKNGTGDLSPAEQYTMLPSC